MSRKPRIGISMCLLGEEVRFDGGHKHDRFLTDTLGSWFEWVPVCPEVEIGLGTPRPAMRLEDHAEGVRLRVPKTGADHTQAMARYAARRTKELAGDDLSGFVLKKGSPSCGMERVKIYGKKGMPSRPGRGLFADRLLERLPTLPVEEEGRLQDPRLRENWIERVFAFRRLRDLFSTRWTMGGLVAFHTAEKLTLMAHSPAAYRELGRLVAGGKSRERRELADTYETTFMEAMRRIATPARHANVLQHMIGYLREGLDDADRHELLELVEDHRRGIVPLVVPITLVRHHVRRLGIDYLAGQTYLNPHPRELALRNHV